MKFPIKKNSAGFNNDSRSSSNAFSLFLYIALILIIVPAVVGADFWEKKEYNTWSERECGKMLQDSPWAKIYTDTKGSDTSGTADGQIPSIKYTVRLISALPTRQATIRLSQINSNYDKLTPEQKQQFDQKANSYLATSFGDTVIIQVEFTTNLRAQEVPLANYWQIQTTEQLKNSTYLYGSEGIKVPPLQYTPPQAGQTNFQFIFPRQSEGKPIIAPTDKSLKLEFLTMGGDRVFIEFKVPKMIMDGEVIY